MTSPRGPMRTEVLTWHDVDKLIDILLPQLQMAGPYDTMMLVTRGGIIPGGMIAEALNVRNVLIAAVDFPGTERAGLMAWPAFLQFPEGNLLDKRRILIIDDVWGSGRTSTAVRSRVEGAGGIPFNCVMHYNPYRSLFSKTKPDFFAATTDAYIVFPWEVDRGIEGIDLLNPQPES
jgi:hypoxanthine phosphoribosyltransferase